MKWLPVCDIVERYSLAWKISKRLTALVQHQETDNREIDGASHWSSLSTRLQREFERDGARTSSDFEWLGCIHRGSNKPRFRHCVESNNNLLYVRAIQGDSGGDDCSCILKSCRNSTQMERILVSCRKLLHRELNPTSRTHRKWKGHERRATNGILHTLLVMKHKKSIRKVHYKNKWKNHQDAVHQVNLEKTQEKGLQFWQTRSHATCPLLFSASRLHWKNCKPQRRHILYQRIPTSRPAPKIVSKNAWQAEHDRQSSSEQSCAFSKESKETIQRLGKIGLSEVSKKILCSPCAKYWPEGLFFFCTCGICLRPSKEQKAQDKGTNWSLVYSLLRCEENDSRGAKHGRTQAQYDHFKANEATRHARE